MAKVVAERKCCFQTSITQSSGAEPSIKASVSADGSAGVLAEVASRSRTTVADRDRQGSSSSTGVCGTRAVQQLCHITVVASAGSTARSGASAAAATTAVKCGSRNGTQAIGCRAPYGAGSTGPGSGSLRSRARRGAPARVARPLRSCALHRPPQYTSPCSQ